MWRVGTVVALQDETATARTITLEVSDWPGHVAGQHVDVRLTASDGYSAVRSYSIASAPNSERRVELTVERLPDGEVSPYLTQEIAVSDRLELRGPIGGWFVWRAQQTEPIQLVAGGSGIVPLMAMIRSRALAGSTAPFRLLYSVREPQAVFLPRGTPAAIRSGPFCVPYLRIHTSCSEGLAATARSHRRRSDRGRDLALKSCPHLLRLRPYTIRRKCCWLP
jgi:ferredoxin-NADP reductase